MVGCLDFEYEPEVLARVRVNRGIYQMEVNPYSGRLNVTYYDNKHNPDSMKPAVQVLADPQKLLETFVMQHHPDRPGLQID